jgi:hypothetical protein
MLDAYPLLAELDHIAELERVRVPQELPQPMTANVTLLGQEARDTLAGVDGSVKPGKPNYHFTHW